MILTDANWKDPPLSSPLRHDHKLVEVLNQCKVMAASHNGRFFAWSRDDTAKRLDRLLVNLNWKLKFEEAELFHLPTLKYDHTLLWINFDDTPPNRHHRPFRFEATWLAHACLPPPLIMWSLSIGTLKFTMFLCISKVCNNCLGTRITQPLW